MYRITGSRVLHRALLPGLPKKETCGHRCTWLRYEEISDGGGVARKMDLPLKSSLPFRATSLPSNHELSLQSRRYIGSTYIEPIYWYIDVYRHTADISNSPSLSISQIEITWITWNHWSTGSSICCFMLILRCIGISANQADIPIWRGDFKGKFVIQGKWGDEQRWKFNYIANTLLRLSRNLGIVA